MTASRAPKLLNAQPVTARTAAGAMPRPRDPERWPVPVGGDVQHDGHGAHSAPGSPFIPTCFSCARLAVAGTEHILLGLIREGHGVAAQALRELSADLDGARAQVIRILDEHRRGHGTG